MTGSCVFARVSRAFRALALPRIYNIVDLSAVPTLLSYPNLLEHVDTAFMYCLRSRKER
jgi:hypothetical protein